MVHCFRISVQYSFSNLIKFRTTFHSSTVLSTNFPLHISLHRNMPPCLIAYNIYHAYTTVFL
jgi:hypothetical protein